VPVLALPPSLPHALPDRQRRRDLLAERYDRRVVGGERLE
jgi:hypothetical protein